MDRHPEHRDRLRSLLEVARALLAHHAHADPSPRFLIELQSKLTGERSVHQKGGGAHKTNT